MKHFEHTILLCLLAVSCLLALYPDTALSATTVPLKLYSGLNSPVGIGIDSKNNLYIAEWGAGKVTRIAVSGKRSTFADSLNGPSGLAIDKDDNVYVASYSDDLIYKFTPSGQRSLFAHGLATPAGLSFDKKGNLLVANRQTNEILSFSPNLKRQTIATGLQTPVGAVITSQGNYFVSNINGGITLVTPDQKVRTINSQLVRPGPGITIDTSDHAYVVDYGSTTVYRINLTGDLVLIAEDLPSPAGLTLNNGALYVATWGDGAIYKIDLPKKP